MSLLVSKKAPLFKGKAVVGGDSSKLTADNAFKDISIDDYKGKWLVLFFYPLDFTFVCPTEIEDFGMNYGKFKDLNCEIVACSTDSVHSHLAWRKEHEGLKNLPYAMLQDNTHEISTNYEVLLEEDGIALRGLYIIDPEGILQYAVVHPDAVGRNSQEILRVLQGLQTGEKTPCNWNPGQKTLS